MIPAAPHSRLRVHINDDPDSDGSFVLYWMVAQRRTRWSFGLQHAVHLAERLGKPLLVLEALRVGYPWASARHHRFILDGMADNGRRLDAHGVARHTYVEPSPGAGKGLFEALSQQACAVVTDHWPAFFVPRMVAAAAERCPVHMVAVDSCGIFPLSEAGRTFTTAASFRRHLQKTIVPHLSAFPLEDPLAGVELPALDGLPDRILQRWPAADPALLDGSAALSVLPIDHAVQPTSLRGGPEAGEARATAFLAGRFGRYADGRNSVDDEVASGLSPYLHYGHVSPHMLVSEILEAEDWDPSRLPPKATGSRSGWWGLSAPAEAFLDQIITWRELGFVFQDQNPDEYEDFESLPAWALKTLGEHQGDPRPYVYTLEELDAAATHDEIWNAAQRQLVREGRIHNYLRMLWGKKLLEWSETPQDALHALIELNNRYALDGRDPNSTSGIFWTLGRFDRAWGPERSIFGKVRFMSSDSTRRKLKLKQYLRDFGPQP